MDTLKVADEDIDNGGNGTRHKQQGKNTNHTCF